MFSDRKSKAYLRPAILEIKLISFEFSKYSRHCSGDLPPANVETQITCVFRKVEGAGEEAATILSAEIASKEDEKLSHFLSELLTE